MGLAWFIFGCLTGIVDLLACFEKFDAFTALTMLLGSLSCANIKLFRMLCTSFDAWIYFINGTAVLSLFALGLQDLRILELLHASFVFLVVMFAGAYPVKYRRWGASMGGGALSLFWPVDMYAVATDILPGFLDHDIAFAGFVYSSSSLALMFLVQSEILVIHSTVRGDIRQGAKRHQCATPL